MHELSIAMSVIDVASTRAQEEGASQINQIDLEIGTLAGIQIESLEFCFEVACRGTIAEGARLKIRSIPGMAECQTCFKTFQVEDFFTACPECKEYGVNITQGKELSVKSIIID